MQRINALIAMSLALYFATILLVNSSAQEPVTLIGTIVKWRYPEAEIGESVMSDAATIAADGNRTVPSSMLKTTMVTGDSVDKVLAFYRDLLSHKLDEPFQQRVDSVGKPGLTIGPYAK